MNKLRTKLSVTCNLQGKAIPTDAIVLGELKTRVLKDAGVEVAFEYKTADDEAVLNGATIYTWVEANALWEAVKSSIPTDATFEEMMNIAFLEAFKIAMAETFGISVSDIEEIN